MKNNTINLVPSGHEVGIVTMVSGEILASFFISFYTSKNNFKKFLKSCPNFVFPSTEYMEDEVKIPLIYSKLRTQKEVQTVLPIAP